MNPIKFETYKNGDIFEYHFYPKDEELIIGQDEYFSNNEKLWKDWCDRDGLPNVIIEAMVAGVPVLASPSGAVSEAIKPGFTGELLDPCQPELWASAIYKIRESPSYADELRKNARNWVVQNCDARHNAEALNTLFLS